MSLTYDAEQLGSRLKQLRKEKKKRQIDLADDFNLSEDSIRAYERGRVSASHEFLVQACEYFQVSMDYLYFGRESLTSKDVETNQILDFLKGLTQEEKKRACEILKLVFKGHKT